MTLRALKIHFATAMVGFLLVSPLQAFSDSDFLQDFDESPSFHSSSFESADAKWSGEFGAGVSVPQNFSVDYPEMWHWIYGDGKYIVINSNQFSAKVKTSYEINAAVYRKLSSWASLGGQAAYSFGHALDVDRATLEENTNFIYAYTWDGVNATYVSDYEYSIASSVKIFEFTPMIKMGPGLHSKRYGLRPYVMGGAGGYFVTQTAEWETAGYHYVFYVDEQIYFGMTGGAGLSWTHKYGKVALEGRFQTVFQTNNHMTFFIPTLNLSCPF